MKTARRRKPCSSLLTIEEARRLPKIVHHEHYDCSIEPEHVLSVGTATDTSIPAEFKAAWRAAGSDPVRRQEAVTTYQDWLRAKARESLTSYLTILWDQVLPTLQTGEHLYSTCKQRIAAAEADGMIFLKLRFAPQLHLRQGLKLQQVVDPLHQAVSEAPFPVRLVVCALRHEDGRMGRRLADLVLRECNPLITHFDLAGDESKFPGVLPWWAKQAKRVVVGGKHTACHIGEAHRLTDEDHDALDEIGCNELGHGINGDPRGKLCTVCVTSNEVTRLVESTTEHPIDEMLFSDKKVNVDLDGTLLTGATSSSEYCLLNRTFGWGLEEFLRCNLMGLEYVTLSPKEKRQLKGLLLSGYQSAGLK